jgi:hypothetical protein
MTIDEWDRILAASERDDHEALWDAVTAARRSAIVSAQRHATADPDALLEALACAPYSMNASSRCERCDHATSVHVPQCALCACALVGVVPVSA